MGWGIDFKADIYLSKQVYTSKWEVEEKINELANEIQFCEKKLVAFAAMTPKPQDDETTSDIVGFMVNDISEIVGDLQEYIVQKYQLELYLEKYDENQRNSQQD